MVRRVWNYRVCKERFHYKLGKRKRTEIVYSLREVYYDKKGKASSWSADPTTLVGDSKEDIVWSLLKALDNAYCKEVVWIGNTKRRQPI